MDFMRKCLLCGSEYEVVKPFPLVCPACSEKVRTFPGNLLTVAERLWGKCYEREQHWEYGATRQDGRPNPIMLERRQVPAAQVALMLSGQRRPSWEHVARVNCGNRSCVRPEHLEWAEKVTGTELKWGKDLGREELLSALQHKRDQRAKYQRDYRANLKRFGVRGMREVHAANLAERSAREIGMERAGRYVAPAAVPYPETTPESTPGPLLVPSAAVAEIAEGSSGLRILAAPVIEAPNLGALLGGVKVAPVE